MTKTVSLEKVADITNCTIIKRNDCNYYNKVSPLNTADNSSLSVFHNKKYKHGLSLSLAGAVFIEKSCIDYAPPKTNLLIHKNPYKAFALIGQYFANEFKAPITYVDKSAYIAKTAEIGAKVVIKSGAYIGDNVVIGEGTTISVNSIIGDNVIIGKACEIQESVTIKHSVLGHNVIVYPGARIGQDGFGFASDNEGHYHIPHFGKVIIGNNVSIGANTGIDRGTMDDTEISDMVQIDNLVQIGHNVKIGKGSVIVAQVGIAGSTRIGEFVTIAGHSVIVGHLNIGDYSTILAKSLVCKDLPANSRVAGSPATPYRNWLRNHFNQLKNNKDEA